MNRRNRKKGQVGAQSNTGTAFVDVKFAPSTNSESVTPAFIVMDAEFAGENPSQLGFPAKLLVAPSDEAYKERAVYVHKEFAQESMVENERLKAQNATQRRYIDDLRNEVGRLRSDMSDLRSAGYERMRRIRALPLIERIRAVFYGFRASDLV